MTNTNNPHTTNFPVKSMTLVKGAKRGSKRSSVLISELKKWYHKKKLKRYLTVPTQSPFLIDHVLLKFDPPRTLMVMVGVQQITPFLHSEHTHRVGRHIALEVRLVSNSWFSCISQMLSLLERVSFYSWCWWCIWQVKCLTAIVAFFDRWRLSVY